MTTNPMKRPGRHAGTSSAKPPVKFCKNCMQPADAHDDAECRRRGPAILPAKPPAPIDGEVGELIAKCDEMFAVDGYRVTENIGLDAIDNWPRIRAALSRQSAELAEAKQGKLAADLRADGWKALSEQTAAELAEARELAGENEGAFKVWRRRCETAEAAVAEARGQARAAMDALMPVTEAMNAATAALTALDCKLGPEGWEQYICLHCGARADAAATICANYRCAGPVKWLPIPGAGAKGDNHE